MGRDGHWGQFLLLAQSPAVKGEGFARDDGGERGGGVGHGIGRGPGGVGLASLGFAAVVLAVLADSSPVSVVAVVQQVL